VCLPGSAASTLLECIPTFSGKPLVVPRLDRAALSVVDFIPGRCICGRAPDRVASCAFSVPCGPQQWRLSVAEINRSRGVQVDAVLGDPHRTDDHLNKSRSSNEMPPCDLELNLELNSDVDKVKKWLLSLVYSPLVLLMFY
jgi:hypothetical protein